MLSRRIRSALFIDFENISSYCPPDKIDAWVAWLEEGEFDENGRRRRLVQKRIYLNASHGKYHAPFNDKRFEIVVCEALTQLKNGLDIRIALDVMESLSGTFQSMPKVGVDEYIIFAKDTDYVPVLQRIKIFEKRSVILGDEQAPRAFAKFTEHADIVVPTRIAREAAAYAGPPSAWMRLRRSLESFFASRAAEPDEEEPTSAEGEPAPSQRQAPRGRNRRRRRGKRFSREATMAAATRATIRVASLTPNIHTARAKIEGELQEKIVGFSAKGGGKYLGAGSFFGLMEEIAKRDDRIKVDSVAGSPRGVRYVPQDEA
jgi:hypothetical protein